MRITSNISIRIHDVAGKVFTFNDLSQLHQFVEDEEKFWEKQYRRFNAEGKSDLHGLFRSFKELGTVKVKVTSLIDQLPQLDEDMLKSEVSQIERHWARSAKGRWLWSSHPYTQAFIECAFEHGKEAAMAFIKYMVHSDPSLGSGPEFLGTMLAYESFHPDSHRDSRRKGERVSLESLRDRLHEETEELQKWVAATRDEAQKWMERSRKEAQERMEKFREKAQELHSLSESNALSQIEDQDARFNGQMESWGKAMKDLEGLYADVLRLKEPAEHWKKAAAEHGRQGIIWIVTLTLAVTVGLVALGYFFYNWLLGNSLSISLDTLNGVVLFGSIMAVYGFFIRILSRLTFSAFHLMRDAKEREQLTYLYLSLSEAGPSERESRDIVLRSLFSRSQTGLLANESGPSIPAEVVQTRNS